MSIESTARFDIAAIGRELDTRWGKGDGLDTRTRIRGEQNAVCCRVDADHLGDVQIILVSHVFRVVERRFDAETNITDVNEILGAKSRANVRNWEFGNLDDTVLDFSLVELEHVSERLNVEVCHRFGSDEKYQAVALLMYRHVDMIVKRCRELHATCNRANAREQFL